MKKGKNIIQKIAVVFFVCVMLSSCSILQFNERLSKVIDSANECLAQNDLSGAADVMDKAFEKEFSEYSVGENDIENLNEILVRLCEEEWNNRDDIKMVEENMISKGWLSSDTGVRLNDKEIKVYIDGKKLDFDNQPYQNNDRVLVPLHPIIDEFGWNSEVRHGQLESVDIFNYDRKSYERGKSITCYADKHTVSYSDTKLADVDGGVSCSVVIDTTPQMKNGEIMIPLRVVAQIIGRSVEWDEYTMSAYIESSKSDEELVDPEVLDFGGTFGSGQSDNYVYDIDNDGKQELITLGVAGNVIGTSEPQLTVYDRKNGDSFEIGEQFPLVEVDDWTHEIYLNFVKMIDKYDWVKKLQEEAKIIDRTEANAIATKAGGYDYASYLSEDEEFFYFRLTNDPDEAIAAEEQMSRSGHLPSGIEMVVYSVNKNTGEAKRIDRDSIR